MGGIGDMGDTDLFSRLGVVLLRPRSPGNVGSVARAMKNMGFTRLIVANPMSYEDPAWFDDEARRMAWQAADLLSARHTEPTLDAALSPFDLVVGTTSNPPDGARTLPPREIASAIATHVESHPTANVALLLGQENIGLTREDLARCHLVGSIPVSEAYPSLNLAQAALLFLYETRLAFSALQSSASSPHEPIGQGDPQALHPHHGQLEAFYARLESALEEIGFFQGTARAHMMRELRLIFNRTLLTSRELAILEGVVHQAVWAARRRG
ncbi:MAG TPA: RNA methyltransferase [Patescibacteria group bacterium]|nr:RNA methyltransferase [Patescibacteria group bacterium]